VALNRAIASGSVVATTGPTTDPRPKAREDIAGYSAVLDQHESPANRQQVLEDGRPWDTERCRVQAQHGGAILGGCRADPRIRGPIAAVLALVLAD
jgi:hypothetical protein